MSSNDSVSHAAPARPRAGMVEAPLWSPTEELPIPRRPEEHVPLCAFVERAIEAGDAERLETLRPQLISLKQRNLEGKRDISLQLERARRARAQGGGFKDRRWYERAVTAELAAGKLDQRIARWLSSIKSKVRIREALNYPHVENAGDAAQVLAKWVLSLRSTGLTLPRAVRDAALAVQADDGGEQ